MFLFKHYNYINKISFENCKLMHNILKADYIKKNNINLYNKMNYETDGFQKWINMISNDKNYNIILCFDKEKLIGFLTYMIIEQNLILCEIQIIPEYQKKYRIFRKLLTEIPKLDNISKVKCTIKKNNLHSIECFTNIGMKNTNDLWYEIDYNNFIKWINKL